MTVSNKSGPCWAGTRTKAETPIKARSLLENSYNCPGLRPVEVSELYNKDLVFIDESAFVRVPAQNGPDLSDTVV